MATAAAAANAAAATAAAAAAFTAAAAGSAGSHVADADETNASGSPTAEPNVNALIAEIRKRPLLYSRDDPDYQNKQRKEECWQDIFAAMEGKMSSE